MNGYDIIGDIHGYGDSLTALLEKLGYSLNSDNYYSHDNRKVIFLGDFIDRGEGQKEVLKIVMDMVIQGSALAIMGNHEFNAISYHTLHPATGLPLRNHGKEHQQQHKAFLDAYDNDPELDNIISWFKTLPLYLELPEIRIVHACWNKEAIKSIQSELDSNNCFNDDFLLKANNPESSQFSAIEILLKGMEIALPDGISFKDSYGNKRNRIRVKWWSKSASTYRNYALVSNTEIHKIPDKLLPDAEKTMNYPADEKPVFFGHYWFIGTPVIQQANAVCLDYSVAKGGTLVAYRWNNGDKMLSNNNFVWL